MIEDVLEYLAEAAVTDRHAQATEMVESIFKNFEDIGEIDIPEALEKLVKQTKSKDIEKSEAALAKIRAVFKAMNDIKKVLDA